MLLGYNTSGLAHHDPLYALAVIADAGYRAVGVTIDHLTLNPFADDLPKHVERYAARLAALDLRPVVETGARYLLDPWTKHEPTLISSHPEARARRADFYRRAIDIAAEIGAGCVSLWSGVVQDGAPMEELWSRLIAGLAPIMDHAASRCITIGFEPEPGMMIDRLARYDEFVDRWPATAGPAPQLTLDIGHVVCLDPESPAEAIRRYASRLVNVHLDDMRRGVHEHLAFGDGEVDVAGALEALSAVNFAGIGAVELPAYSRLGPQVARDSFAYLSPLIGPT